MILNVNSIKHMIFVTDKCRVYFEIQTELFNII